MLRWFFRTSLFQADLGLLAVRLFFGLSLALGHGLEKVSNFERFINHVDKLGLPFPQVLGTLAGLSEFLGGFLVALGLLTRGAAAAIGGTLFVAAFYVAADAPFVCSSLPCQELALCYGAAALGIFLAGPGRLSADFVLIGRKGRKGATPPPSGSSMPPMPPTVPTPPPSRGSGSGHPEEGSRGALAALDEVATRKADGAMGDKGAGSPPPGKPPALPGKKP